MSPRANDEHELDASTFAAEVAERCDFLDHETLRELIAPAIKEAGAIKETGASKSEAPEVHKALDPNLPPATGGYAFLWDDVFSLSELLAALAAGLDDPKQLGTLAANLVRAWSKLRDVRVALSDTEYRVLAAIKTGASSAEAVSQRTSLEPQEVKDAVAALKAKKYGNGNAAIPLVEENDGELTTRF